MELYSDDARIIGGSQYKHYGENAGVQIKVNKEIEQWK